MNILIATFGTRGDIQPYIALGIGLKRAGYEVGICTSEGYRAFVEEYGLRYVFMNNELLRLTQSVLSENTGVRETLTITRQMAGAVRRMMDDEWQAAVNFQPDLIVYHPKCLGSLHVAEKLRIPAMLSLPLPFYTPTRAFPVPFMSGIRLGGWFNHFSYRLMGLTSGMYRGAINDFRAKALQLPPQGRFPNLLVRSDGSPVPILYPYSRHVLPVPEDFPAHVHVTGYWFLDHPIGWQPEARLVQFLESGAAPVYVGFGSVGGKGAQQRARITLEALQRSGQRGVLVSGWSDVQDADLPGSVFMLENVPHDWLFPQMAAVVHHGGAGTTAAGLRAGKPTVICPFMADQPFWGGLVYQLGAGPMPIPQRRLTADRLADAITAATQDETIKRQAAVLGRRIRSEDGVAQAVEIISAELSETTRVLA